MTSIQRKPVHAWQIIMLSTGVGILLALMTSWGLSIYFQKPPSRIPSPPSKAKAILGVRDVPFGTTMLFIQSVNGESYQYSWKWEPALAPENLNDIECRPSEIQQIEAVAGRINNCRQIQTIGEWVPGALISYAITANGDLWQLSTPQWIMMFAILFLAILTPLGLLVGVIIVTVRWIVGKAQRKQLLTIPVLISMTLLGLCVGIIIVAVIWVIRIIS